MPWHIARSDIAVDFSLINSAHTVAAVMDWTDADNSVRQLK